VILIGFVRLCLNALAYRFKYTKEDRARLYRAAFLFRLNYRLLRHYFRVFINVASCLINLCVGTFRFFKGNFQLSSLWRWFYQACFKTDLFAGLKFVPNWCNVSVLYLIPFTVKKIDLDDWYCSNNIRYIFDTASNNNNFLTFFCLAA
jgi:hypothetical protein